MAALAGLRRWQTGLMKAFKTLFVVSALSCATFSPAVLRAQTAAAAENGAAALSQKYTALEPQLTSNVYQRPLVVTSTEGSNTVSGDIYAELASPFTAVTATFKDPRQWCEVLILHLNTKSCRAGTNGNPNNLPMHLGRKHPQDLKDATELQFVYRLTQASNNYFEAGLNSDKGPVGTSNYRIALQAIPLPNGKTFMHLQYAYSYGLASKIAMQGYLATLGSGKVGFTPTGAPGSKNYVGGMRGAVERNAMRYYLAIDAYLASLGKPPAQQFDARVSTWFEATEQYAEQLHEVDKSDYLSMKAAEHQRQLASP